MCIRDRGVVIFLVCLGIFLVYQSYFLSVGTENHLDQVSDLIVSNILKLSEKDVNSSITLSIPKRITDSPYQINLSSTGLNISVEIFSLGRTIKKSKFTPLYGINESYTLNGKAVSSTGTVIIYKKGNKIILKQQ